MSYNSRRRRQAINWRPKMETNVRKTPSKGAQLRQEIKNLEFNLNRKRQELTTLESTCQHDWTEPKFTPTFYEGYTDPGDPPGTMGVDHRSPTWVPSRTVDKWTRTCKLCDKVETTERTETKAIKQPVF